MVVQAAPAGKLKTVEITPPDPRIRKPKPSVPQHKKRVRLSKSKHERIIWLAPYDNDFTITFPNDTPFNDASFTSSPDPQRSYQYIEPGPPVVPGDGTEYKYEITMDGETLDPSVVIDS